jgi:hypothetical protein
MMKLTPVSSDCVPGFGNKTLFEVMSIEEE